MEDSEILTQLGLTDTEANVYLTLVKLGEGKLGEIQKEINISSSSAHQCLKSLIQKGLISFILKNNIKYYCPSPPNSLKQLLAKPREELAQREKQLEKLIPHLQKVEKLKTIAQTAEVFVGFTGLRSAFQRLCNPVIPKEETYFLHKYDESSVRIAHKFFTKLEIDAEYRHIPAKGVCSTAYKAYFEKRQTVVQVKYTDHPIPSNVNIYADKILIISWSEQPLAFLIQSQQITNIFKDFFHELWKIAKK